MRDWMRALLSTPVKEFPRFEAGLSLLPSLPPEEAVELLETRLAFLKHDIEQIKRGLQTTKAEGLAALFTIESEYRLAALEAERSFVEKLIPRIERDGCGFLKQWKKWHSERKQPGKGNHDRDDDVPR